MSLQNGDKNLLTASEWREKYEASEKELRHVKNVANKAVVEHEDLYFKYSENKKQYGELQELLAQKDSDIEKLREIFEPFVKDFRNLEIKVEFQEALREEAEKYARKAHKKFLNIKRKSMSICQQFNVPMTAVDIDIDGPDDDQDQETEGGDVTNYQERISDLEQKLMDLAQQLNDVAEERDDAIVLAKSWEDEYNSLKRKNTETSIKLTDFEKLSEDFKRATFLAVEEINVLELKYEEEQRLRQEAMDIAQGFQREKKIIQHQSQAVIGNACANEKLRNALLQLEDLTRENEVIKESYEKQIKSLESQYSESTVKEKLSHLERCIEVNDIETENLKKDIEVLNKRIEALDYDKRCLQEKLDLAVKANQAPPPPPPPPPPPIKAPINPILGIFRHKKKPGASQESPGKKAAVKGNENYDKALSELMDRITARKKQERSADLDALVSGDKKRNSRVDEITNVLASLSTGGKQRPVPSRRHKDEAPAEKTELEKMFERRKMSIPPE